MADYKTILDGPETDRSLNPYGIAGYFLNIGGSGDTYTIVDADTWYVVPANFSVYSDRGGFDFLGTPDFGPQYVGGFDIEAMYVGSATLDMTSGTNNTQVSLAIFKDGVEQPQFTNVINFPNNADPNSFGTGGKLTFTSAGQEKFNFRIKASNPNTTIQFLRGAANLTMEQII